MDGFYKFCNPTSLFTCNHFEWLFYLHLKKLFFFVKGTPTLSLSFWFVDKQWPLSCNARLCHKERNGMLHNRESRKSRLYIAQVKYKKNVQRVERWFSSVSSFHIFVQLKFERVYTKCNILTIFYYFEMKFSNVPNITC